MHHINGPMLNLGCTAGIHHAGLTAALHGTHGCLIIGYVSIHDGAMLLVKESMCGVQKCGNG